jgi:hypothetical protein
MLWFQNEKFLYNLKIANLTGLSKKILKSWRFRENLRPDLDMRRIIFHFFLRVDLWTSELTNLEVSLMYFSHQDHYQHLLFTFKLHFLIVSAVIIANRFSIEISQTFASNKKISWKFSPSTWIKSLCYITYQLDQKNVMHKIFKTIICCIKHNSQYTYYKLLHSRHSSPGLGEGMQALSRECKLNPLKNSNKP